MTCTVSHIRCETGPLQRRRLDRGNLACEGMCTAAGSALQTGTQNCADCARLLLSITQLDSTGHLEAVSPLAEAAQCRGLASAGVPAVWF